MIRPITFVVSVLALLEACSTTSPPLYAGLDAAERAVSTDNELAQRYFDQGLALCWGFNHDEATRSFEAATKYDPGCAMAWWGSAFALGPNINLPLTDKGKARRAHAAAQKALQLSGSTTEVERALIEAQSKRYADPPPDNRAELDRAYAEAMRSVRRRFPHDPDVGTLFADSLMLLSKEWRRLRQDGDRGPHTPEIVATLEKVLAEHPDHPGANHFYIHAVEASTRPERGLPSADRLVSMMPAAGHLLHMPSHIYIRVGQFDKAIAVNENAIHTGSRSVCASQGRWQRPRSSRSSSKPHGRTPTSRSRRRAIAQPAADSND